MYKKGSSIIFAASILALMGVGCISLQGNETGWKAVNTHSSPFEHVVKWPGETLQKIAKWYTGDSDNWKSLADANPQIDSNTLSEGNIIFIPSHLLKTRKAPPQSFISASHTKQKPKAPPSPKKPSGTTKPETPPKSQKKKKDEKDEFELFGPK
jgi:hypothetical protein